MKLVKEALVTSNYRGSYESSKAPLEDWLQTQQVNCVGLQYTFTGIYMYMYVYVIDTCTKCFLDRNGK